jgi:hypothetical protein
VIGIDLAAGAVAHGRERASAEGLGNLELRLADAYAHPGWAHRLREYMKLFTIGFTKKSAEKFFRLPEDSGARRLADVRLKNTSQLAGFAKRDDLEYFVRAICGMNYMHVPEAPTRDILDVFKKQKGDWRLYARRFLALMAARRVEESVPREVLEGACLLCSEERRRIATGALWPSICTINGAASRWCTWYR